MRSQREIHALTIDHYFFIVFSMLAQFFSQYVSNVFSALSMGKCAKFKFKLTYLFTVVAPLAKLISIDFFKNFDPLDPF
jgi:hypothetical protein